MTVATLRDSRLLPVAAAIGLSLVALLFAKQIALGSVTRDAMIAGLLLAPFAIALALSRPLIFPYALYVALLPFDMFLSVSKVGTLTKLLGITSGLLLLFFCLRTQRLARPRLPLFILGVFIAWAAFTLLWAIEPSVAVEPLQTLFGLMLLYAALSVAPISSGEFKILLVATLAGYFVAAWYGISAFHDVVAATAQSDEPNRMILMAGSHYIDPNEYADSLIFPIAIAMMFAFRSSYLFVKLGCYSMVGAMVVAIALSGSREAVISLVAVVVYFAVRSRHRKQLFVLVLLIGLAAAPMIATMSGRFANAIATGGAGRTSIWAVGLAAAKHYGLFGAGIGSFPIVYDRFYLSVPQTYLYGWSAPPHNVLLRYWVELGVVGLALVVLFIAAHFTILRAIRREHPLYDFRIVMEAGLIGVCISALFIDSFHSKWTWLVFATAAQLVTLALTQKRGACKPSTSPESSIRPNPVPQRRPVPVLPTSLSG